MTKCNKNEYNENHQKRKEREKEQKGGKFCGALEQTKGLIVLSNSIPSYCSVYEQFETKHIHMTSFIV